MSMVTLALVLVLVCISNYPYPFDSARNKLFASVDVNVVILLLPPTFLGLPFIFHVYNIL